MRRTYILTVGLLAATPGIAHATTVYPGCAVPSLKASHHTFYIDPVNGSQKGDGSAAKPWHTLAEVVNTSNKLLSTMGHNDKAWKAGDKTLSAVNPAAPIKPGDVLLLKSGNHGDVRVFNSFNNDFITVAAAPGNTPVLSSLTLLSSSKWLFQGLKILGAHPNPTGVTATVSFGRSDYQGATSDVILDSSTISASDDTSTWTDNDWKTKTDSYEILLAVRTTCLAATNNSLSNGMNGIAFEGDHAIVQNNQLTRLYNDGIDFYGSNQIIRGNTITGGTNNFATEALHPDGIQGWSQVVKGSPLTNVNDVVDGNTIIKTGKAEQSQMQGITIFNGSWDGLHIINNVVVSNVWHGIAIYGGKNVEIMNNTVLASDPNYGTWILANKLAGQPGQNIVIRNNIASNMDIEYPNVTYDHNLVASRVQTRDADNHVKIITSGPFGDSNKVIPGLLNQFVTADAANNSYNLRLKPNSNGIAAGTNLSAPTHDIVNKQRSMPFDVGAYEH